MLVKIDEGIVGWAADGSGAVVATAWTTREGADLVLVELDVPDEETGVAFVSAIADVANAPAMRTELDLGWLVSRCGFVDGVRAFEPVVVDAPAVTLAQLEEAIVSSWSAETSMWWSADNPARGQCDVTALLVRELLGGEIMCANVVRKGVRVERHAWNRLPGGIDIDLTRRQFDGLDGFGLEQPVVAEPHDLDRLHQRAAILRASVRERLGR